MLTLLNNMIPDIATKNKVAKTNDFCGSLLLFAINVQELLEMINKPNTSFSFLHRDLLLLILLSTKLLLFLKFRGISISFFDAFFRIQLLGATLLGFPIRELTITYPSECFGFGGIRSLHIYGS